METNKHADRISLCGIKIYPRIGVTAEERATPQQCRADLEIWGDFQKAAATDSLEASIDYCGLLAVVQEKSCAGEYLLVETLAYAIIQEVLHKFGVMRTRVKIRKQPAVLSDQLDYVEVAIEGVQPGN